MAGGALLAEVYVNGGGQLLATEWRGANCVYVYIEMAGGHLCQSWASVSRCAFCMSCRSCTRGYHPV